MSGSEIARTQNQKTVAISRNMHITGKEKMAAIKPNLDTLSDG